MKMLVDVHEYHKLLDIRDSILLMQMSTKEAQAKRHLLNAIKIVEREMNE